MKYFLSIIFLLFITITIKGQSITYTYDKAGNQTNRTALLSLNANQATTEIESLNNTLFENTIHVYPNPTKGDLFLEFSDQIEKSGEVSIKDISGRTIFRENITQSKIYFNLSSYSSGIYILSINIDGKSINQKIVKK